MSKSKKYSITCITREQVKRQFTIHHSKQKNNVVLLNKLE